MYFVLYIEVAASLLIAVADSMEIDTDDTDVCRAWTVKYADHNKCECAPNNQLIECSENQTIIKYQVCVTYNRSSHEALVGMCPFNSLEIQVDKNFMIDCSAESNINLTSFMCDPLNRTGELCSQCKAGLGPALLNYSHPCLECTSYGWVAYFAATLIPSTAFMMIIIVFQVDALMPALNYYILHCHMMTYYFKQVPNLPHSLQKHKLSFLISLTYKALVTIFGIWNLDFFRSFIPSFCATSNMNILTVLAMEYVVAIYPLLFTATFYGLLEAQARGCWLLNLLWKPFHPLRYRFKKVFNIRGSVINAFATFFCLSYFKILMTSFDIGSKTTIIYSSISSAQQQHRLYFNSSIPFEDEGNIPYFVLAFIMTTVFCVLPLLVLLTCPTKNKRCACLCRCNFLCEVLKIFQNQYKDGSNGTSDYRSFSGLFFAFRILFLLANYFSYTYSHYLRCLISLLVAFLIAYLRPYKNNFYNYLDSFWFAEQTVFTLTLLYQTYISNNTLNLVIIGLGGILPLLYIVTFRVYRFGKLMRSHLGSCHFGCCKKDRITTEEHLSDWLEEYRPLIPIVNQPK